MLKKQEKKDKRHLSEGCFASFWIVVFVFVFTFGFFEIVFLCVTTVLAILELIL